MPSLSQPSHQPPCELASAPAGTWAHVAGVLTDIDDTLTCDGAIEPAALRALQALESAGLPVVAITGRPMGWSRPFAQAWPLRAIVAENGAVALIRKGQRVQTTYAQDKNTRQRNALLLQEVAARVIDQVPGAMLARDSAGRATDIAIDHSEFTHLAPSQIRQIVVLMQQAGMNATVSSIHINGWFGNHSKWTGAQWMVQKLLGRDLQRERPCWVYVGDSTNDQVMFERFPLSVGVANLRRFAAELQVWPAFITQAERGEGFAELTQALLAARARPLPAGLGGGL